MADLTRQQIEERVYYHHPTATGVVRHEALAEAFADLIEKVQELVPEGRERALTITKLEEAKMWASAGVARNPDTR